MEWPSLAEFLEAAKLCHVKMGVFYLTCIVVTWAVYTRKGGLLHDIERSGGAMTPASQPAE